MKVILSGKGGSGKSTVSVMASRALARRGYRVLLIDADESNMGLHRLLGVDPPKVILDSLGGKKGFKERRKDPLTGNRQPVFTENTPWTALGPDCVRESGGVYLASVGKIHEAGEGCACPIGILSRELFSRIYIGEKDIVLIDTAAGIEHFGRSFGNHVDLIVGILDPSYESLLLSEKMDAMAKKEGLAIRFVLNRTTPETEALIRKSMRALDVVGAIAQNDAVFKAGLEGRPITVADAGIEELCDAIVHHKREGQKS